MGKHPNSKSRGSARPESRVWLALALAAVLAAGGYYFIGDHASSGRGKSFSVQGGEQRPVLNPFQFSSPQAAAAYMAAMRHPTAMDQVYCYCQCDRPPFYHKSLLSCFTDRHGAT